MGRPVIADNLSKRLELGLRLSRGFLIKLGAGGVPIDPLCADGLHKGVVS